MAHTQTHSNILGLQLQLPSEHPLLSLRAVCVQDEDRLVAAFEAALAAGGKRVRLAVLDLILSFPPVILPVQRLCQLFRCAPCQTAAALCGRPLVSRGLLRLADWHSRLLLYCF